MWKTSQKVICISKYFWIVPHPKPMEGSEKFPINLHRWEMKSQYHSMFPYTPGGTSAGESVGEICPCFSQPGCLLQLQEFCNRSHGTTSSRRNTKWLWYPIHNICSAALEYHTVTNRVCLVIKGWLYRACSQSIVFLNCLSLRRRLHNERVSVGHELETDFVLLGKVMFTNHSLGVPDGCRQAKGWGGRSPQHSSKWP